ncbi:MAG: radical SAM protein [Candidatus Omnitrophota bacterium]
MIASFIKVTMRKLLIFLKYGIFSDSIRIDASTICQLRCPTCQKWWQRAGQHVNRGYLRFKDFKKFVDKHTGFKKIELSNDGEIFLNPELSQIIKYAYRKKIMLTALTGVNLNDIQEEVIKDLVIYKVKEMRISIDGASEKTYAIYRKNGNFKKVIENIGRINYYKQQYNSEYPQLTWVFIMFKHNIHEISYAREIAGKLNMKFRLSINTDPEFAPLENEMMLDGELIPLSMQRYERRSGGIYHSGMCLSLWTCPQINWDGKLMGCPCNRSMDFGNVFEEGLRKCLRGEKYVYAKKMLLGKAKPREDIPCFYCDVYKKMCQREQFLEIASAKGVFKRLFKV